MQFLLDLFWSVLSFFTPFRCPLARQLPRKNWWNRGVNPPPVFSPVGVLELGTPVQQYDPGIDNSAAPTLEQATMNLTSTEPTIAPSSERALEFDDAAEESEQPQGSLSGKASKGASWTAIGALFTQVLGLARTAALARLLSQNDFGVAAMALTVIGALYTLTNTGVGGSVISMPFKSKKELYSYANSVWTMEAVRGVAVSFLLALLALPMARFYRDDRLTPVLLALALTPISTALLNIGLGLQVRQLEFRKSQLHAMLSGFLGVALTVGLAWWMRNYWALVWGQIVGSFVGLGLSFVFSSYRPRFNFEVDNMRRAFDFGKHIFIIGMAGYILTVMDNVIVGRVLGATALGIYVIAYSFCNLPRAFINTVFNSILLPMFASVSRDSDANRVNTILERAVTMACIVLLATITPLVTFAPAVVRVIYGLKWESAIGPMRVLLLAGFVVSLLVLLGTFLIGINRPQLESKAKVLDAVFFLCVIYPFTVWQGTIGAAMGSCLTAILSLCYRWYVLAPVVPQACRRLPWLIGSALLCFVVVSESTVALIVIVSAGQKLSIFALISALIYQPLPSLGTSWLQLLLGLPLVALASLSCFVLLHPTARGEMIFIVDKMRSRFVSNTN